MSALRCALALAVVFLAACAPNPPKWQQRVWDSGFIPLPALAVIRVVEPDEKSPEKVRPAKNTFVGSLRVARPEDFPGGTPLLWRDAPQLSEVAIPVQLAGGADAYEETVGLTFNVDAVVPKADVKVKLGPSRSVKLTKLQFVDGSPLTPENLHLVLQQLVGEMQKGVDEPKTFFLVTRVLAGDIDEQTDLGIELGAKYKGEKVASGVDVGGKARWAFGGHGIAVGVKGLILTRQHRGTTPQPTPIARGSAVYEFNKDRIHINRDSQDRLRVAWQGVPGHVFARVGQGEIERVKDLVPAGATDVLLGTQKAEGWWILGLQLFPDSDGSPMIISGSTYVLTNEILDAGGLQRYIKRAAAPSPAARAPQIDRNEWSALLGDGKLLEDFVPAQQSLLAVQPNVDEAPIERYDIAEVLVPAPQAGQHDWARVTRYDVRNLGGKKFTYDVYRASSVGIVRSRLWARTHGGELIDMTPAQRSFTSSRQTLVIPGNVDYLYQRAAARHDTIRPSDMVGFFGGRFSPVGDLNWSVAFVAPLGRQCKLVLGEAAPGAPTALTPSKSELPDWAREIFAVPGDAHDDALRAVQGSAGTQLDVCRFEVRDVGRRVAWVIYD